MGRALHDDVEAVHALVALGLSYATAAEICACPVGTIRSRVARARDDLIALLRDAEETSSDRSAG